jgi:hypothetical protein
MTLTNAWFRTYSASVKALLDCLALALVGAVTGYRYDDGNAACDSSGPASFQGFEHVKASRPGWEHIA